MGISSGSGWGCSSRSLGPTATASCAPTGRARRWTQATRSTTSCSPQISKYAYAKTLKLQTGDTDVDAHATGSPSSGRARPATDNQLEFIEDLQQRCEAAGADPDDWPEMQRTARGFDAASKQIDTLLAIEEAYQDASGQEARQLAAAGVEDARNGEGS
jgi:hypothetical protein